MESSKEESKGANALQNVKQVKATDVALNFQFDDYPKFLDFCDTFAKSGLCSLDSKEDVALAILAGRSLSLDPITALNNIYPIQGKATLSIHLMAALLIKAGCIIEKVYDYKPLFAIYHYQYDTEGNIVMVKNKEGKDVPNVLEVEYKFKDEIDLENDKTNMKPIAMGSRVRITRSIKQPDGTFKSMVVEQTFTTFDAQRIPYKNGNILNKDNWKSYPANMFYAGAFRTAARLIGADIIGGLYSTEEMLDVSGVNYRVSTETGEVIVEASDVDYEEVPASDKG